MKENECTISERDTCRMNYYVKNKNLDRSSESEGSPDRRKMGVQKLINIDNSSIPDTENFEREFMESKKSLIDKAKNVFEKIEIDDVNDEIIIEGFIISAGRLIIRTINDLSSELVGINKELHRQKDRNENRAFEIDRLKAMIRVSSGDGNEYRERIRELGDFIQRTSRETWLLKNTYEHVNLGDNHGLSEEKISLLKSLMNGLRRKLKNDREALFSGGNQWCSMYVKKVHKLGTFVERLLLYLGKSASNLDFDERDPRISDLTEYQRGIRGIQQLGKRVAYEFANLTKMPIKNGFPIGGKSCAKYSKKIHFLEKLVRSSMTIIDSFVVEQDKKNEFEKLIVTGNASGCRRSIEILEGITKKLVHSIRKLERFVAANDGVYLLEKIRHLEASVRRARNKLSRSEEEKDSLRLELTGAKISYGEKTEELEKIRKKYEKMVNRMKKRGESLDCEEQVDVFRRELEATKLEANALREEVTRLKPEVTSARSERAKLLSEIENIRCVVDAKNGEIAKMTRDKRSKERSMAKETSDTRTKLAGAENEIQRLKNEISNLKNNQEIKENETATELKKAKSLLKVERESLESQVLKLSGMENNLIEIKIEKTKIEQESSCLRKENEALVDCLNFEKSTHANTLKDFKKLIADYRALTEDLSNAEMEKKDLQKGIDDSEREKSHLRAEIDDYQRKKYSIESEISCVRSKLEELERILNDTREKNVEMKEQLSKINRENIDQANRVHFLEKENEKLSEELDGVRSDKLNIAGALNEAKYDCEMTKNLLDTKINEMKNMEEKLNATLVDLQSLKKSENSAKLEIEKLLETNANAKRTLDMANLTKAALEKRFEDVKNDCQELENRLSIAKVEKDALTSESYATKQRIDELNDEVTILRQAADKNICERTELVNEHRNAISALQKKLDEFEKERAHYVSELERIVDENTALKRDYEKIVRENENVRSRGKKSDINRLTDENEALKIQLSKLRIFISEADRDLAKKEMERMCSELVQIRAENSSLKKLRNRKRIVDDKGPRDSRKLEEELNACKSERASLEKNLEMARNKIAIQAERSKELETERDMLKGSIEGLKERYKLAKRDMEDARLRNEALDGEISELKNCIEKMRLEDSGLERELENLRRDLKSLCDDNSETKKRNLETENELVALKNVLARLRTEKACLSTEIEAKNADSRRLETENACLRGEIEKARCARILAIEETNVLRGEQEELASVKITLENKLIDARKEIGKYVVATEKLHDLESKLRTVLKSYVITKKLLRSAREEIDLLRRFAKPCFQTFHRVEKIQAN